MTVYGKIENGVFTPAPYGDIDYLILQGYSAFDDDLVSKYNAKQAIVQKNKLVDITNTADYKARDIEQQKVAKATYLNAQIDAIDKKRIRAVCEPSVKDESSGQTWLDFYNEQIKELRAQIAAL